MKRTTILLLLTAILPLFALLKSGLPVTHDGQDHVARIANFYQSLSEGNMIPRWAANLNWGYGHPILMFLYPFPSYLASVFHFFSFSFVDSTKLVFGVSYVLSILFMFLFVRDMYGETPAIGAALLYGFAPYRFVDLYVRGALGEHVAFMFPPLILWGLFGLAKRRELRTWGMLTSIGTAGLILSHNAISLMVLPIVGLFMLYLWLFQSQKSVKFFVVSVFFLLLGFLWSFFFWMPAFFEGKYTLRDIVTKGEIAGRMVPFSWFFYSPWGYGGGNDFTKQIGLAGWVTVILSVLIAYKKPKTRLIITTLLVLFAFTLFMMTDGSIMVWNVVTLLQKFQFPWRLLTVTTVLLSLLTAYVLTKLPRSTQSFTLIVLLLLSFISTVQMWQPKGYKTYDEAFFTGIYDSTTDTGESSPIWSIRFMEHRPSSHIGVITGQAFIEEGKRNTTEHTYTVRASEETRLVENTVYFPGWVVQVDAKPVSVEFQDPRYRGLITFYVSPGIHTVTTVFTQTKLRRIADIVTILSLLSVIPLIPFLNKRRI